MGTGIIILLVVIVIVGAIRGGESFGDTVRKGACGLIALTFGLVFLFFVISVLIDKCERNKPQQSVTTQKSIFGDYDPIKPEKPIYKTAKLSEIIGDAAKTQEKFTVICEYKQSFKLKTEKNGNICYIKKEDVKLMFTNKQITNDLNNIPSCSGTQTKSKERVIEADPNDFE